MRARLGRKVRVDVRRLPSQGLFYSPDFGLHIKSASEAEIIDYESGWDRENVGEVLRRLKSVVRNNTILENGYDFSHIKSIDIVYLFLEIVGLTRGRPVEISYFDDETSTVEKVKFGKDSFCYFKPGPELGPWNPEARCFEVNGYRVSLPSIGVENSLTQYLMEKSYQPGAERYNDYTYDFTFLLDGKNSLRFDEIDNLIQIFNYDIDEEERDRVAQAVGAIKPMQRYSVVAKGKPVDMSSKINLEKIWK